MDKSEIQERVVKVICSVLNIDADMVTPKSNFAFDLGAESTQSIQLVAGFEEEFDIELDADAALSVDTVNGAVEFIRKQMEKSA